ncbi:MAG TPA: hypothetical protein VMB79_01655 [Jatrophihabitans sp.]|nr:hypothetical protein [Jatrophihabitans sp.]
MSGLLASNDSILGVTHSYVEACQRDPRLRDAVAQLELPPVYRASFGDLQLDRPIFMAGTELDELGRDLREFHRLMLVLPDRCFGSDLDRYCAAINLAPSYAAVTRRHLTGQVPVHGRADVFHDGTRFRLLEYNVGSELGGMEVGQLNRSFLAQPAFRAFSDEHGLTFHDPIVGLVETFRQQAKEIGVDNPVVGLVDGNGVLAGYEHLYGAIQENVGQHGIEMHVGELHEVRCEGDEVYLREHRIDLMQRFFITLEIADDEASLAAYDRLLAAHDRGRFRMVTTLEGHLYTSKATLGLLHEPTFAALLTDAERDLVRRLVPWTRVLSPRGDFRSEAEQAELIERCRRDRESLVIKPGIGYGGFGTVIGSDATPQEWEQTLTDSAGTDWVVQERVASRPEPVVNPETGEVEDWIANWGVFVDESGYNGAFIRALKPADGSIVAYANPGTRGACVFAVPAAEGGARR